MEGYLYLGTGTVRYRTYLKFVLFATYFRQNPRLLFTGTVQHSTRYRTTLIFFFKYERTVRNYVSCMSKFCTSCTGTNKDFFKLYFYMVQYYAI